jgi:Fe-S cluster assembly scaffold protein SufB
MMSAIEKEKNLMQENLLKDLMLKDLNDLSSKIDNELLEELKFSLLKKDELGVEAGKADKKDEANEAEVVENIPVRSLHVIDKQDLRFFELKDSMHLILKIQKDANLDLAIIMNDSNKTLIVEAFLDENSFARIYCLSDNDIITKYYSLCEDNSRFEAINFSLSGLKSNSRSILQDNASCLITNSYLNINNKSSTNDVVVHAGRESSSLINSRAYLIDSTTDSRGLIKIEPSAFDAQGFQDSAILMEGNSKAISIPDLEILNNEVKCSHGSTISRIKDEDLFYFESRGISKADARRMLIEGHLLSALSSNEVKEFAYQLLQRGVYS